MAASPFRSLAFAVGFPMVALLALAALFAVQVRRLTAELRWINHADHAIAAIHEAQKEIVDEETSVRGYLLTRDARFLEPVRKAQVTSVLGGLREWVQAEEDQRRRVDEITELHANWRARAQSWIESPERERPTDLIRGMDQVDAIRDLVAQFLSTAESARAQRSEDAAHSTETTIAAGFGLFLLVGATLSVSTLGQLKRTVARYSAALREEAEAHRTTHGLLEQIQQREAAQQAIEAQLRDEMNRRERAMLDLSRSEQTLDIVLRNLPVGVMVAERDGTLAYWNSAVESMLRGPCRPVSSVDEWSLYRAWDLEGRLVVPEQYALARALRGEQVKETVRYERFDGTTGYVSTIAAPLRDEGGEIRRAVAVVEEITREMERQQERERNESFRELFVGMIGHDLRNPLNAITVGLAVVLRRGTLTPQDRKVAERMSSSASRMSRMIEQILDVTRSRLGGGIQVRAATVDLRDVVASVQGELSPEVVPQIAVVFEGRTVGQWDHDRLVQVFGNLLSNALAYGEAGSLALHVAESQESAVVRVHNLGPPIPEDLLAVLFDPFRRGAAGQTRRSGGLGLGLYIVQQIVRAHGGEVTVRSSLEAGTTFEVTLPYAGKATAVSE